MNRDLQIGIGISLIGIAAGVGVWLWKKYKGSGGATSVQAVYSDLGNGYIKAVVTWSGGQGVVEGDVAGGVQGDKNIIDGHFFTSQTLAQQATDLYTNNPEPCWQNPSQAGCQQSAAMVSNPQYRLAAGNNQAVLYAGKPAGGSGAVLEFWVRLGTDTTKLIASDPVGTNNQTISPLPNTHLTYTG